MILTSRQESRIHQAHLAGIKPARIAELIGCKEKQVLAVLEEYRLIKESLDEWDNIIKAEKAKDQ